jgi:hypothetical protein
MGVDWSGNAQIEVVDAVKVKRKEAAGMRDGSKQRSSIARLRFPGEAVVWLGGHGHCGKWKEDMVLRWE